MAFWNNKSEVPNVKDELQKNLDTACLSLFETLPEKIENYNDIETVFIFFERLLSFDTNLFLTMSKTMSKTKKQQIVNKLENLKNEYSTFCHKAANDLTNFVMSVKGKLSIKTQNSLIDFHSCTMYKFSLMENAIKNTIEFLRKQ